MRIIFAGSDLYAKTILQNLHKHFNVVMVFTQKDAKVGRKQELLPTAVKSFTINNDLNVNDTSNINLEVSLIKSLKADFFIVASYAQFIKQELINTLPIINLHTSLLPKYRGASPIESAILNNDKTSGVSSMLINIKMDAGDILEQKELNIENLKRDEVYLKMSDIASTLTISSIKNFNNIKPLKQDDKKASYCSKIQKKDALISLESAFLIETKHKAFYKRMDVFLENGLKLQEISLNENESSNEMGEILDIHKDYIVIACKKGSLKVKFLQEKGKKSLKSFDYINGKRLKKGDKIA